MNQRIRTCIYIGCVVLILSSCGTDESGVGGNTDAQSPVEEGVLYQGLSVEQANSHLSFPLILPTPMPPGFTLASMVVHRPVSAESSSLASAATVEIEAEEAGGRIVTVRETSETVETPSAEAMQEVALLDTPDSSAPLPAPSQETQEIAGWQVLHTTIYAFDGVPIEIYSLNLNGIHVDVTGWLAGALSRNDLEQLVASIVEASSK